MTLAQLKRHMDRRFDRLQRTKADKADLARFATKDDLKGFATKDDLKGFATKDDLKGFATKDDFRILVAEMNRRFDSLNDKIDSVLRFVRGRCDQYDDVVGHHGRMLDAHDRRITDLEQRNG